MVTNGSGFVVAYEVGGLDGSRLCGGEVGSTRLSRRRVKFTKGCNGRGMLDGLLRDDANEHKIWRLEFSEAIAVTGWPAGTTNTPPRLNRPVTLWNLWLLFRPYRLPPPCSDELAALPSLPSSPAVF
ncbi:hypothetical protein L484_002430 [Morus notabilis]|uniref:Uncharacterized protein n=1 Tax=Morus notabilis TaxID=981085 RepID=W9QKR7_9ROSA|nr:hypothetical protein L484_002430 [Morus notabilis]